MQCTFNSVNISWHCYNAATVGKLINMKKYQYITFSVGDLLYASCQWENLNICFGTPLYKFSCGNFVWTIHFDTGFPDCKMFDSLRKGFRWVIFCSHMSALFAIYTGNTPSHFLYSISLSSRDGRKINICSYVPCVHWSGVINC